MEGTISSVAREAEDGSQIELSIRLRDVVGWDKLTIVESICKELETTLEELMVIRNLAEVYGIES